MIVILDFGSQYTHGTIARRVREAKVCVKSFPSACRSMKSASASRPG